MPIDFLPSNVALFEPLPFVDTFKHAESECMAAMVVATLAASSDTWRPVRPSEMGAWAREVTAVQGQWRTLLSNPFMHPHPHKLVAEGFCRWTEAEGARDRALEFTDAGMDGIRKWVRTEGRTP